MAPRRAHRSTSGSRPPGRARPIVAHSYGALATLAAGHATPELIGRAILIEARRSVLDGDPVIMPTASNRTYPDLGTALGRYRRRRSWAPHRVDKPGAGGYLIRMDTDQLLELEHAGWRSLCNGTGSDFYGSTMTEDGLMVMANGMVMDRRTVVAALAAAPAWASYSMSDVRIVPLGAHAATVVYRGQATREDGSEFVGTMSSVYARADDGWRLALYQQTEVRRP